MCNFVRSCVVVVSSSGGCGTGIIFWCSFRKDTLLFFELVLHFLSCQCVCILISYFMDAGSSAQHWRCTG